ncbi:MAG: hypothetical protein J6A62_03780 [Oscillospiraceae bacterium]|nr:hypothetical protein [Oscillospiraceae bacterium]
MPDTSIVVKATDKYSDVIKRMAEVTKSFGKDVDALEGGLRQLSRSKASIKLDLSKAKAELKAAEKACDGTDTAMKRLSAAQINVDHITRNLKVVTNTAKETEKQISKIKKETGVESGGDSGITGLKGGNALKQYGKMLSTAGGQLVDYYLGSALGDTEGAAVSSVLSNTISGVMVGLSTGTGLVGALVGGTVGLISGGISAATASAAKKDDFFKDYYGKLYEGQLSAGAESLTAGSATAGSREQRYRELEKKVGGERAKDYLKQIEEIAAGSTYGYDELLDYVLSSEDPAEALKERRKAAAGSAPSTYEEKKAELADVRTGVEEGYGTGYNEERKSALQAITLAFVRVRIPRVF